MCVYQSNAGERGYLMVTTRMKEVEAYGFSDNPVYDKLILATGH
jgi:hypothetical protein